MAGCNNENNNEQQKEHNRKEKLQPLTFDNNSPPLTPNENP
jgi:hypothetical protein